MLMCPADIVAGMRVMSAIISCSNVALILGDEVRLASMDTSLYGGQEAQQVCSGENCAIAEASVGNSSGRLHASASPLSLP